MKTDTKEYKFKITTVIPVYNVESFLEETVDSVIAQDIGFEENVQIILVNDGSRDNSEEICLKYQMTYPNNIKYVFQENGGVSCARNNGKQYAEGKYVNFLDSDDKWSPDAYSKIYEFFEEHYDEIDLVSAKMIFFDAATHVHSLSKNKYYRTRVTNIHNNYKDLQLHVSPCFIKQEVARRHEFVEGMCYGEDALFVNKIILEKQMYGLVAETTFYYRKRNDGTSAVQNKHRSMEWYLETPVVFYQALTEKSKEMFGEVIPYIQNLLMYEIQWRLKEDFEGFLSEEQQIEYKRLIRSLLLACDDDIIAYQDKIHTNEKIYLLSIKYGEDIRKRITCMNGKLYMNNLPICKLSAIQTIRPDIMEIKDGRLWFDGRILSAFENEMEFWFEDEEGTTYPIEKGITNYGQGGYWGTTVVQPYTFKVGLPLKNGKRYCLQAKYRQYPFVPKFIYGKFAKLNDRSPHMYYENEEFIVKYENGCFVILDNTDENRKQCEALLMSHFQDILKNGSWSKEGAQNLKYGMKLRKRYFRMQKLKKKKIWLISDRVNFAGDNGEAFFEYMRKHPDKTVEPYFVISSSSKDYRRMRRKGNVIRYKSSKHLLYTMLADKIISSHGEDNIGNPFEAVGPYVRPLCHFDMVFLQHGITKDDLSTWLNKYNKNLGLIVTAAKPEYDSFIKCDYNYEEEKIALTGFARYDRLVQKQPAKKEIIILPTWRPSLAIEMDPKTGNRLYNPEFVNSEYFKFYNRLINDERILSVMKEKGYTGKFCLHQNNIANVGDFEGNNLIRVEKDGINYNKEFLNNSLLITDYSSVAYDFAYLKKPVVYIQFDREEFFENAVYDKGYWDYERDGFGPVCEEYEQAVETIVKSIEADCKIEPKYKERLEKFYLAFDQNNSKRIYDAICSIGKCSKEEK